MGDSSKPPEKDNECMDLHALVDRVVENKLAQREAIHKLVMGRLGDAMKAPIMSKPIEIRASDIAKKESSKGSPLKGFIERKKKPKEYSVEIAKSETVNCDSCDQKIFGDSSFSGCICFGENMGSKIWVKKTENGVSLKFSRNWTADNISLLLETLRERSK